MVKSRRQVAVEILSSVCGLVRIWGSSLVVDLEDDEPTRRGKLHTNEKRQGGCKAPDGSQHLAEGVGWKRQAWLTGEKVASQSSRVS